MSFLRLPKDARFSNKMIFLFMLPIFVEQLLIASMSMADTWMISRIPNSEAALAGVANVARLDTFIKQVFVALAAGGSIFVAQYIGARRYKEAGKALKLSVVSMFAIASIMAIVLEVFKKPILMFLYGSVEPAVMQQSLIYYTATICAYPFMALFNAGAATFRAMGKSKISLYSSLLMMSLNIALKYILIFHFNMGVMGAGISLLIAYAITGISLVGALCRKNKEVYIDRIWHIEWDGKMLARIYNLAVPTGIENGMFQLGALILQSLVASLGTVAINANHLVSTITPCSYAISSAFVLGIIPFVGQCMGANRPDEAEMYIKHIIKINMLVLAAAMMVVVPLVPKIISIFGMSEEISLQACAAARVYFIAAPLLYPLSFAIPSALRGTGDTRFTMIIAITTMFTLRIGAAYLLVLAFDTGMIGIWIAMVLDWVARGTIFTIRFKMGKWKRNCILSE